MKTIFAVILTTVISTAALAVEDAGLSPAGSASGKQDQTIEQLLTISGMKKSLQNLSTQAASGFMQTALRSGANADAQKKLIKALEQAFPEDVFVNHAREAMKKRYNEQRYAHFLQLLSVPLSRRMLELEAKKPNPTEVQAFFAQVSKHSLSPERIKLIQRMDAATKSSALLTMITISSLEAGTLAAGDDCGTDTSNIKKMIEKNRPAIEKANRNNMQAMLAFIYRDASDADLGAYLKMHEEKDSRSVRDIVFSAIEEQFKLSVEKGMQGMKNIIQANKPRKTMFAPKCGQSESPSEGESHQKERVFAQKAHEGAASKPPTWKSSISADKLAGERQANKVATLNGQSENLHRHSTLRRDLRYCLHLATDAEIIACAER